MWFLAALAFATLVPEGRALFEQNRFREARAVLERAVRSQPDDRSARYWLGYTCVALGDFEAAIMQFERVESAYANDPEFLFAAAEAYTRAAREASEALSAMDDASARRHQHLAARHLAAGDQPNALVELQAAIQRQPALAGLHEQVAEIYWTQKNYDGAAQSLRAELEINPSSFIANLRYGQYLLQNHKAADAVSHLRTAVRYHRYPEAHQLLAFALIQLDRGAEAQAVVRSGLEAFPDNPGLIDMRKPGPTPANYAEGSRLRESAPLPAQIRSLRQTDERLFWLHKV